jgi:hypothetical protein
VSGTLVVAILALTVSTSTLTWQIVQFILGSSRVSAELRYGAHNGSGAMTMPVGSSPPNFDQLKSQGWTELVLAVQVRNSGRLAVSVTNWTIAFDNGGSFTVPSWSVNGHAPIPYRLEPGSEQTWLCPLADVMAAASAFDVTDKPTRHLRARAALGNGKIATSKNRLALRP